MVNICYTCFDGDNDIRYYRLMQAWHENDNFDFTFQNAHDLTSARDSSTEETIKRSLRKRLNASDVLLVLVGSNTKNLYKFVRWEIEVALEMSIPIIAINLDGKRTKNSLLCPPILRNELAIHIPFSPTIVNYAIKKWPSSYKKHLANGDTGAYFYKDSVYKSLDL